MGEEITIVHSWPNAKPVLLSNQVYSKLYRTIQKTWFV